MQIHPIFSLTIGNASLEEHLPLARELFVENKNNFKQSTSHQNMVTTLGPYTSGEVSHKESEKLEILKKAILNKAIEYVDTLGYKTSNRKISVSNIWFNEMKSESVHKPHYHYGANLSGCFYVDMPKDCGSITYTHNFLSVDPLHMVEVKEYNPANSEAWSFSPSEGDVYFWKATLQHEVQSAKFDGVRRCISFDVQITE